MTVVGLTESELVAAVALARELWRQTAARFPEALHEDVETVRARARVLMADFPEYLAGREGADEVDDVEHGLLELLEAVRVGDACLAAFHAGESLT